MRYDAETQACPLLLSCLMQKASTKFLSHDSVLRLTLSLGLKFSCILSEHTIDYNLFIFFSILVLWPKLMNIWRRLDVSFLNLILIWGTRDMELWMCLMKISRNWFHFMLRSVFRILSIICDEAFFSKLVYG